MFYENIIESSDFIRGKITETPKIGVVLGSGLGALVDVCLLYTSPSPRDS